VTSGSVAAGGVRPTSGDRPFRYCISKEVVLEATMSEARTQLLPVQFTNTGVVRVCVCALVSAPHLPAIAGPQPSTRPRAPAHSPSRPICVGLCASRASCLRRPLAVVHGLDERRRGARPGGGQRLPAPLPEVQQGHGPHAAADCGCCAPVACSCNHQGRVGWGARWVAQLAPAP
jgi:hypothetical protein